MWATVAVAVVAVGAAAPTSSRAPDGPPSAATAGLAGAPQDCRRAADGSALIRTVGGELRQVPFRVGWDIYTGRRPGTLVAVCVS